MVQNEEVYIREISRQDAICRELRSAQAAFQKLVRSIPETEWKKKSPTSEWTIGQVFIHLTWALEYLPKEVESARKGKGMFNMPKKVSDFFSYWYMVWLARKAAPENVIDRYNAAMDQTIRLVETVRDEEWALGADFYGEGFHSIEDLFHVPPRHLAEHTTGIIQEDL
jgi:hypothetical protein